MQPQRLSVRDDMWLLESDGDIPQMEKMCIDRIALDNAVFDYVMDLDGDIHGKTIELQEGVTFMSLTNSGSYIGSLFWYELYQ